MCCSHEALKIEEVHSTSRSNPDGAQGWISAEWGQSENNAGAKFYELTKAGRQQLETHRGRVGSPSARPSRTSCGRNPENEVTMRLFSPPLRSFKTAGSLNREMMKRCGGTWKWRRSAIARPHESDEARCAALRQFGGLDQLKERERDARGWVWLEQLAKDCRFAVRSLAKSHWFSLFLLVARPLATRHSERTTGDGSVARQALLPESRAVPR